MFPFKHSSLAISLVNKLEDYNITAISLLNKINKLKSYMYNVTLVISIYFIVVETEGKESACFITH